MLNISLTLLQSIYDPSEQTACLFHPQYPIVPIALYTRPSATPVSLIIFEMTMSSDKQKQTHKKHSIANHVKPINILILYI